MSEDESTATRQRWVNFDGFSANFSTVLEPSNSVQFNALLMPSKQLFQWLKSHTSSHRHFLDKKQILFQIMVACLSSTELVAVVHFVIVCWGAKTITGWGVWSYAVWDLSAFWPIETAKHIWSGFGIWNRLLIYLDIFENIPITTIFSINLSHLRQQLKVLLPKCFLQVDSIYKSLSKSKLVLLIISIFGIFFYMI